MGNKLCNCPNICPNYNNETSLSNKINNLISNNSFSNVIPANFTINFENESINKKILDIYKKNCVNKIIKTYKNHLNNQIRKSIDSNTLKNMKNYNKLGPKDTISDYVYEDKLLSKENDNVLYNCSLYSEDSNRLNTISEKSKNSQNLSYIPKKIFNTQTQYENIPKIEIRNKLNNNKENSMLYKESTTSTKREFNNDEINKNKTISFNDNRRNKKLKFNKINNSNINIATFKNSMEDDNLNNYDNFKNKTDK